MRVVSYNVDGLSETALLDRTGGVCELLEGLCESGPRPALIFLQEVIEATEPIYAAWAAELGYRVASGRRLGCGYHVMLLVDATAFFFPRPLLGRKFLSTVMGRHMLTAELIHRDTGAAVTAVCTHLESCMEHAPERSAQLRACLDELRAAASTAGRPQPSLVLLGGDLNLRDAEVPPVFAAFQAGYFKDAWEAAGAAAAASSTKNDTHSAPSSGAAAAAAAAGSSSGGGGAASTRYTWDQSINDNLGIKGHSKPRCRFDRILFHSSGGAGEAAAAVAELPVAAPSAAAANTGAGFASPPKRRSSTGPQRVVAPAPLGPPLVLAPGDIDVASGLPSPVHARRAASVNARVNLLARPPGHSSETGGGGGAGAAPLPSPPLSSGAHEGEAPGFKPGPHAPELHWRVTSFSLLGTARLPSCGMFPSDHWGIVADFECLAPGDGEAAVAAAIAAAAPPPPAAAASAASPAAAVTADGGSGGGSAIAPSPVVRRSLFAIDVSDDDEDDDEVVLVSHTQGSASAATSSSSY